MKKQALPLTPLSTGKFESFDGTPIYYEVHGEGEPIVFAYGIACLINHFHFQIEHFSRTHQVIVFDLRGHHMSGIPLSPDKLTMSSVGKDLGCLLRTLSLKSAHFVGHSFGVPSILAAYEESPSLFKTVTFINGFAKNPIKGMFGLDVIEPLFHFVKEKFNQNPILWGALWRAIVDNPATALMTGVLGGFNLKVTQFKDIEIYAKGVSQVPLEVFIPLFESMMAFDGTEIANSIKCPVLIMSGERDFVTPQKYQHELHHNIVGSEFVSIPYGSHCCQLDFPDFVNLKIHDFIDAHP